MNQLSPIILFVYNRPIHTQKTITALKKNKLAMDSELFIYSDAARNELDVKTVDKVRELISSVSGFKQVTIIKQEKNKGLADSIIDGVTETVNKYGKVIVLEDDIITSEYFLKFMNDSLNFYQNNDLVYSISGCNYPIDLTDLNQDTYFLRIPLCWGWATWQNRWVNFNKDITDAMSTTTNDINYINFENTHDYFSQILKNNSGDLNTWFIFWYLNSARNKKLTLFPKNTLVNNIGHDGSGQNCGLSQGYEKDIISIDVTIKKVAIEENKYAFEQHKKYFLNLKPIFIKRVLNKLKRMYKELIIVRF